MTSSPSSSSSLSSPLSSSLSSSSSSPTAVRSLDNTSLLSSTSSKNVHQLNEKHAIQNIRDDDCTSSTRSTSATRPARSVSLLETTRNLILKLSVLVGNLSSMFLQYIPPDYAHGSGMVAYNNNNNSDDTVSSSHHQNLLALAMAPILATLQDVSMVLSLDLEGVVRNKMELNARKYPAELCKGKAGKYTEYSYETGITKDKGQSTLHALSLNHGPSRSNVEEPLTEASTNTLFLNRIADLTDSIREFAQERHWEPYHLPRNLLLAMMGELGELAELFQFKGDGDGAGADNDCGVTDSDVDADNKDHGHNKRQQYLSAPELDKIGQEIADVCIYFLRLADVCGVDLEDALRQYYLQGENYDQKQ